MRVLLCAQRCEKGALDQNLSEHRRALEQAREEGCALVVFPEMSLTGSVDPVGHPERLIELADPAVKAMVALTDELGIPALFGIAERVDRDTACITQVFAEHGRLAGLQRKRQLGEDEEAYRAADVDEMFVLDDTRFAVAICAESGIDRPFLHAQSQGAALVCFCAAPGLHGRRTSERDWRAGLGLVDLRRTRRRPPPRPRVRTLDRHRHAGRFHRGRRLSRPRCAGESARRSRRATSRLDRGNAGCERPDLTVRSRPTA